MKRLLLTLSLVLLATAETQAADVLYFTSTRGSWIGQGQTLTLTLLSAYRYHEHGAYTNAVVLQGGGYRLELVGPDYTLPTVGFYPNATRWPFMGDGPGLCFTAPGRCDNELTGSFNVLQAEYTPSGDVQALAVDFLQYDETSTQNWVRGTLRYHSEIPLPEPASAGLLLLTSLSLLARRRH